MPLIKSMLEESQFYKVSNSNNIEGSYCFSLQLTHLYCGKTGNNSTTCIG